MQTQSHRLSPSAAEALRLYVGHRAGDRQFEALRAASEACHEAPQAPQPHYAYGEAWLALGQHANAARAFAEAVRLAPAWPDAWINLGVAHYRLGAIEDAKTAMRQALVQAPDHAVACANLAAFMRITGEAEASERLLTGVIARAPENLGARLNLAADWLQEERALEALTLLDAAQASPQDPRAQRHWLLLRSLALLQLRRLEEAEAVLAALADLGPIPVELAPLWHWRWILLEQARGKLDAAVQEAALMATALSAMGPNANPEHRIMGHFDLAKFWSGRDAPTLAFEHWRAGHALLKPLQPFDRAAHRAFIDANIASFNRTRIRVTSSNRDPAPVFIVGMPRSGTTLCEQILAAHADVHGAGERPALGRMFAALGGGQEGAQAAAQIAGLSTQALDTAAAQYLAELHAIAPGARRIVDKMPGNYRHIGLAARMLPGARFIHCVRDPRDIGVSIFTFRFYGTHGYAHDLADLGWCISEQQRLMAHWKRVLPRGRILTVALEDWVRDFDATLARVLEHLDLAHDQACERFYESDARVRTVSRAQVREPVNARGLGRWRAYAAEIAPLLDELKRGGCLQGLSQP